MPVIIEFSRCIGTYSSAKFEYKIKGRAEFGEVILDLAGDERLRIDRSIRDRIEREKQLRRVTPIWAEYDYYAIYWFVNIPNIEVFSYQLRKKYIYANMMERRQKVSWSICLDLSITGKLNGISIEKIDASQYLNEGFTTDEIMRYNQEMKYRRKLSGIRIPPVLKKKIYPNDLCLCGSGKKYKKCCGKNQV